MDAWCSTTFPTASRSQFHGSWSSRLLSRLPQLTSRLGGPRPSRSRLCQMRPGRIQGTQHAACCKGVERGLVKCVWLRVWQSSRTCLWSSTHWTLAVWWWARAYNDLSGMIALLACTVEVVVVVGNLCSAPWQRPIGPAGQQLTGISPYSSTAFCAHNRMVYELSTALRIWHASSALSVN
jgi:hypothetical protein